MALVSTRASLFFAGLFHYGSVSKAAKAFGIARTTFSDIVRPGKIGGKTRPTATIKESTETKVAKSLYKDEMDEDRTILTRIQNFFKEKISPRQIRALAKNRDEPGEDSFYHKENLMQAVRSFEKDPSKRNPALVRALREIDS